MKVKLHILEGSGKLKPFLEQIKEVGKTTLEQVGNIVSFPGVDVIIYDNPDGAIEDIGIGGYTPSKHLLFISLNPDFSDFINVIDTEFPRILIHELTHTIRFAKLGYEKNLFEALISEGLADHFEKEITHATPHPWSIALDEKQLEEINTLAKKEYTNENYDYDAWFTKGSKEKGISRWSGYSLGFDLIAKYLKKTNKNASQLLETPAEDFI